MKVLSIVLLVGSVMADKAPYPPSGWKPSGSLLLLPQQQYGPPPPPTTPQEYGPPSASSPPQEYGPPPQEYGPPAQDTTTPKPEEDLEKVNEMIMERLRKEEGSDTGVYYVYLPDGRLQRVQYTSAPLKVAPNQQSQQTSFTTNQQSNNQAVFGAHQFNTQSNALNALRFGSFARQQSSYDAPPYPPTQSSQFNQAPSFQNSQFAQYNQQGNAQYDGTSKVTQNNKEVETPGEPQALLAKYVKPDEQKTAKLSEDQQQPSKYVASVSYTNVDPITGPIYSFNNQPLVRVLRYAPLFQ